MAPIHKGLKNKPFLEDEEKGKYSIMICEDSGMRATPACKNLASKKYKSSKIPTELCTDHPYEFNENLLTAGVIEKNEEVEGITDFGDTPSGEEEGGETLPEVQPSTSETEPVTPPPAQSGNEGFVEGL